MQADLSLRWPHISLDIGSIIIVSYDKTDSLTPVKKRNPHITSFEHCGGFGWLSYLLIVIFVYVFFLNLVPGKVITMSSYRVYC